MGVDAAPLSIRKRFDAARLAKINTAEKLSDNNHIDAFEHTPLKRRSLIERRHRFDRPQVGEKVEVSPNSQQALCLAYRSGDRIESGPTGRAEQNSIGFAHRNTR